MLLIHNIIVENKGKLKSLTLATVQKNNPHFSKNHRHELKRIIEHLIECTHTMVVTSDSRRLTKLFDYLSRSDQKNPQSKSLTVRFILCFTSLIRQIAQKKLTLKEGLTSSEVNRAHEYLDKLTDQIIALYLDTHEDYTRKKMAQEVMYLEQRRELLGLDLSKLILFRG